MAQGVSNPVLLEPIPGLTAQGEKLNLSAFLQALFKVLLAVGAILAVIMLVIGGVQLALSEAAGGRKEALSRVKNAVLGLLLLFGSVLLLQTINPDLLDFKFLVPAAKTNSNPPVVYHNSPEESYRQSEQLFNDKNFTAGERTTIVPPDKVSEIGRTCRIAGGRPNPLVGDDRAKQLPSGDYLVTCKK